MKAFKVTWRTFTFNHGFAMGSVSSESWKTTEDEKFFGTKEAAEKFVDEKNKAAQTLGLYPNPLSASIQEVNLE
jgi:hypothetical protein